MSKIDDAHTKIGQIKNSESLSRKSAAAAAAIKQVERGKNTDIEAAKRGGNRK